MGLLKEVWTGELLKAFRQEPSFMKGIPDYSALAAVNNTIHLADVGVDPSVLINNTTYPIAVASRVDTDKAITLDKFDTTNTKVQDDELRGLSYDKIKSVNEQHKEALVEKTGDKSIHALAPASDSASTPVFATAAATFGIADIIKMKKKFDDNKVPAKGRRLVLCPEHIEGLLKTNENFAKQYNINTTDGVVGRLMGFDIFEYVNTPVYNTGTKAAFGAASDPADKASSIAFFAPRMMQAQTKPILYMSKAEDNPTTRESVMGYRLYHICVPKKNEAIGAIISQ